MVNNRVPWEWHSEQNFPEFFFFTDGADVFINIRDVNNDWQTTMLMEDEGRFFDTCLVWGASIENKYTQHVIDLLFVHSHFSMMHSYGYGGFSSEWEKVYVIRLDNGKKVLEFTPMKNESGGETEMTSDSTMVGQNYTCAFSTDFYFSHDSLIIDYVDVESMNYTEFVESEVGSEKRSVNSDCHPELEKGVYIFDGEKYNMR
jgi:hypothetical protein